MAPAWLDSLSEDWVSEPRSDTSQAQLPPMPSSRENDFSRPPSSRDAAGRKPRAGSGASRPQPSSNDVLSERSSNEINVQMSRASHELKMSSRGRNLSRSFSASTTGSVLHSTVQHKSLSASPTKSRDTVPEWKRILLHGDRPYGEARDLFSSAGAGLENIFQPPPPQNGDQSDGDLRDMTMPSSPPPYLRRRRHQLSSGESSGDDSKDFSQVHTAPPVVRVTYKRNDESYGDSDHSTAERSLQDKSGVAQEPSQTSFTSAAANDALDASRKISGKSVVRNEDFSPIFLTRRDEDGKVSFTPVELPAEQLKNRLDKLRRNQMFLDSDGESREQSSLGAGSSGVDSTEDFARHGGFLNLKRGGLSADGSFQHRALSPPLPDSSEMLPESSLQASTPKQFPGTIRLSAPVDLSSPNIPAGPNPSPVKRPVSNQANGGSPLKLFGPYDTFTNQTLLRRISQFEDSLSESPSSEADQSAQRPPSQHQSPSKSEFNRGFMANSSPRKPQPVSTGHLEVPGVVNRFGAGELDDYVFSEDISMNPSERSRLADKENVAPREEFTHPDQPDKLEFSPHSSIPEDDSIVVRRRRNTKSSLTASTTKHPVDDFVPRPGSIQPPSLLKHAVLATPKRDGSDGKRPRTSPSKDPTPKRRRTLHRSDIAYGVEPPLPAAIEAVLSTHRQMQNGLGWSRKYSLQDTSSGAEDAASTDNGQALRVRTPTPSQGSSLYHDREPLAELRYSERSESQVASSEGSGVMARDFGVDESRKTSMITQDYLDAAAKIMAAIRSRARASQGPAQNGLASVEESDAEDAEELKSLTPEDLEDSFEDSFEEPFVRPPSREGRLPQHVPARQENPELADRLKKYEEGSDMGDLITYSMRSMGLAKEAIQEVNKITESVRQSIRFSEMRTGSSEDRDIITDMPGVRLTRNQDASFNSDEGPIPSHGSVSSRSSSVPSGSSRNSDSRRLIAPDAVSELIGDQVGNMMFDRQNNVWMRVRASKPVAKPLDPIPSEDVPSEDSEEDPFASIPDLSVDDTKEKQHLDLKTAPLDDLQEYLKEDFPHPPSTGRRPREAAPYPDVRSILTHTREASAKTKLTAEEENGDIEHEITLHEDRMDKSTPSKRRNLTITFSSPVASFIDDLLPPGSEEMTEDEASSLENSLGAITSDSLRRGRHIGHQRPTVGSDKSTSRSRSRSRSKSAVRNIAMKAQAFVPRPVSRIDEQDEDATGGEPEADQQQQLSIIGDRSVVSTDQERKRQRPASLSFVITTPAPLRHVRPAATPTIADHVGTLSLSPLSDFTMNHGDRSYALEVSYVVDDDYLVTGDRSKRMLTQAVRSLVEKITEVEPFEPDWDGMQVLDISDKQLKSLHKLDEFCGGVVTLDASNNLIGHLDGVPESVRNLKMTHNQLSDLSAWGHLMNLQYVDISDNQINSLYAFKDLVHLRNLRADNNQITSLEGIKFHDSLQVLRVRGNLIEDVDFDGTNLVRLTELDLRGNQIRSIRNIEQLPCLSSLNLEKNALSSFAPTANEPMPSLKHLKLSDNLITELDLSAFPSIRLLHVDRNQLRTLRGTSRARRLDSLSLREQKGDIPLDLSFLRSAYEVRKLFLSGNLLTAFEPQVDFLNLQYLELANCGLQSLADNFGQLTPNLRTLNLNFNAIEDLSPLRYIPRLKKLLVAGNRLADAGTLASVLTEFPHLSKLDLRDNLATQGFYPPHAAAAPAVQHQTLEVTNTSALERLESKKPSKASAARSHDDGDDDDDARGADPFVLPEAADPARDAAFARRLDMGTKKRRRFYEIVLSRRCGRLRSLDGLPVDRPAARRRDDVWQALLDCGAIQEAAARHDAEGPSNCEQNHNQAAAAARPQEQFQTQAPDATQPVPLQT